MDDQRPDFEIVDATWESRLRDRGLTPSRSGRRISTGFERLEMEREETEVAEYEIGNPADRGFIGSVEVKFVVELPELGEFVIKDLVTQRGTDLNGSLAACANAVMDVTYPPIEALFTGVRPDGPGTGKVTLTSFTIELDMAIRWDVMLGQLQILNDPNGELAAHVAKTLPLSTVLDTLTGYLSTPRLHWCRLYIANPQSGGLTFRCAINGQRSAAAEAEMRSKFGTPPGGDWELRQFFTVLPVGPADDATTMTLRTRAAETFGMQKPKSLWSRLFGRRS